MAKPWIRRMWDFYATSKTNVMRSVAERGAEGIAWSGVSAAVRRNAPMMIKLRADELDKSRKIKRPQPLDFVVPTEADILAQLVEDARRGILFETYTQQVQEELAELLNVELQRIAAP